MGLIPTEEALREEVNALAEEASGDAFSGSAKAAEDLRGAGREDVWATRCTPAPCLSPPRGMAL